MAATTAAAATSSFIGTRLPDVHSSSGRVQARFGFGTKKPKKKAFKPSSDRPLWFPGAKAPEYLDGSLVGDYGFDPFGLGKPAEYLQYELDSLDQNLAKNLAGDIIGTRFESADVKSTPFQPYTEVFGLQRFRECELIHGRWAMLATLGALTVEWLTGVTWQDAGKGHCVIGICEFDYIHRQRGDMGRLFFITLEGNVYSCKYCRTHLALSEDIMSKSFLCRHGKAYLFDKVVNVTVGETEERMMITGMHTVVDIFCVGCGAIVGWKYESAQEKGQKYKEGKIILERFKVLGPDGTNYMVSQEAQVGGSDADDA